MSLTSGQAIALASSARLAARRRAVSLQHLTFVLPLAAYLAAAVLLVLVAHVIQGDAWSRVANASYVLFGRDPHLAAIGFTWNPLPSIVMLPLLPLRAFWPAIVNEGFAANIVSAAFMAGAVYQLGRTLHELDLTRLARTVLLIAFAASPLILHYGANGMSEAPFLFFLVAGVRYLTRWLVAAEPVSLAATGVSLGLAYLTRYEGLAAAASAFAVVGAASFIRTRGDKITRAQASFADVSIIAAPVALGFFGWAAANWIITGSPFEFLTSPYGIAQLRLLSAGIREATGQGTPAAVGYVTEQILGLQPFLAVLVGLAGAAAIVRRDPRSLVPLAVLGGVLAFEIWAFLSGRAYGNLRYYIVVVPLAVLLVAAALARSHPSDRSRRAFAVPRRLAGALRLGQSAAQMALLALIAASIPATMGTMMDGRLGRGESYYLGSVLRQGDATQPDHPGYFHHLGRQVAGYVDALNLPEGAVLADAATSFPVILQSHHPRQFVITPDRDFRAVAADPAVFDVRYILISKNPLDALWGLAPGIGASGSSVQLVEVFGSGASEWRLYEPTQ